MKYVILVSAMLALATLLTVAGCSGIGGSQATPVPTVPQTTIQTVAVSTTALPTATTSSLKPGSTDTLPSSTPVDINVEKAGTYATTIITNFNGGKGMGFVSKVDVKVTRADGTVVTGTLKPMMGQTLELEGTNGTDRVEVIVTMKTGNVYKVIDQQMPYKTRG
jgi:hypothetical protein